MTHQFLSEPWLEAAGSVQEAVAEPLRNLGADIRLNVSVEGCPPGAACSSLYLQVTPESVTFSPVWSDRAEATVHLDYRTARRVLTSGSIDVVLAEMIDGAITTDGDFLALIRFGGLMATDGSLVTAEIGRRLTLITDLEGDADDDEMRAGVP